MQVGFVGLGDIGMPMAQHLVGSGHDVVAHDLDAGRLSRFTESGGTAASAPEEIAACDVVCLAVPDDPAVESIVLDDAFLAAMGDGTVLVHSTILPSTAQELGRALRSHGVSFHDAPVSGGAARARTGDLSLMVGGEPGPDARTVLDALGSTVLCGPVGAGAAVKLANQLSMLAALAALHEGLALTEHYGAPLDTVLEVLGTSTGASWSAANWGFFDDLAATYDGNGVPLRYRPWSKDLWDVVAAARAAELHVPVAGLLAQVMPDAVEQHSRRTRGEVV